MTIAHFLLDSMTFCFVRKNGFSWIWFDLKGRNCPANHFRLESQERNKKWSFSIRFEVLFQFWIRVECQKPVGKKKWMFGLGYWMARCLHVSNIDEIVCRGMLLTTHFSHGYNASPPLSLFRLLDGAFLFSSHSIYLSMFFFSFFKSQWIPSHVSLRVRRFHIDVY